MTNHQYVRVERTLLKRGITDFERKLKAAAVSGALGYAIVQVVRAFYPQMPDALGELIPYLIAIIGGWSVHSAAVTTTFSDTNDGYSVRVGPAGTPVGEPTPITGTIPVPPPVQPEPPTDPPPYEVPDSTSQSFTEVVTPESENATKVYSPGAAFWAARNAEQKPTTSSEWQN